MASLEDFLRYGTTTQVNATRPQPKTPAVIRQRDALNQLYEKSLATGAVPQQDLGGWKGLVQDIAESPIGGAIFKAAEVLDVPRRAVVSVVKEFKDAVDFNPETKVSWDELVEQVQDPTFGFGDVTGNLFGDSGVGMFFNRVVGFAGDVVLDPLTWVTLGGSKAITYGDDIADQIRQSARVVAKAKAGQRGVSIGGKEGRFALAKRLLDVGAPDSVAVAAARYGRPAVKDADLLAKAGVNRAGLYWMGKRVPLTTKVGETLESGFANVRTWMGDNIFKKPAALFTPEDATAARIALARGTAPTEEGADFIRFVLSRSEERATIGAEKRVAQVIRNEILGSVARADIDEARGTAYKLMDMTDAAARATGATAQERVAMKGKEFFERLIGNVRKAMTDLDPDAPVGEISFYFPHMPTEDSYRWMSKNTPEAVKMREVIYNPLDNTGSYRHRMTEGSEFFGRTLTNEDIAGGVDRLNQIAIDSGMIDFKFFETDLPTVIDRYVDMYAGQMGRIARRKYLVDTGVFDRLVRREILDGELVKQLSKKTGKAVAARSKAMKDADGILNNIINKIDETFSGIVESGRAAIDEGVDAAKSALRAKVNLSQNIQYATRELEALHGSLAAHAGLYARVLGDKPAVVSILEDEYSSIVERIDVLRQAASNNQLPIDTLRGELHIMQSRLSSLEKTEALLREQGNVLQRYIDDIISGKEIDKVGRGRSRDIQTALFGTTRGEVQKSELIAGRQAQPLDEDLWNSVTSEILSKRKKGKTGGLDKGEVQLATKRYSERGGEFGNAKTGAVGTRWWMESTQLSPISPSKVAEAATAANLSTLVQKAMRGEATLTELRVGALALLSTSESIPNDVADALKTVLRDADQADNFYSKVVAASRDRNGMIALEQSLNNWMRVETSVSNSLRQHYSSKKLLDAIHGMESVDSTLKFNPLDVVPQAILERLAADPEYAPIAYLFTDYIDDSVDIESLANMSSAIDSSEFADEFMQSRFSVRKSENGSLNVAEGIGLSGTETAPVRRELTFGEMDRILRKAIDEIEDMDFIVSFERKSFAAPTQEVSSEVIYMGDIMSRSSKSGMTFDDIGNVYELEEFIGDVVSGTARKVERPAGVVGLGQRIGKVPAVKSVRGMSDRYNVLRTVISRGENGIDPKIGKWLNNAADATTYASMGDDLMRVREALQRRLSNLAKKTRGKTEEELTDSERLFLDQYTGAIRELDSAIKAIDVIRVPAVSKSRGVRMLRGSEEIADISIRGEIEAIQKQLDDVYGVAGSDAPYQFERGASANEVRRARADIGAGRGGKQGVKTAKRTLNERMARESTDAVRKRLEKELQNAWFLSEINSRFTRLSDALFKVGLAPDKDLFRKVVNTVARDKAEVLARESMLYFDAHTEMKKLLDELGSPAAWDGRTDELYELIVRRLNPSTNGGAPPEWSSVMRNVNGRSDASRLRATLIRFGGADGNSGIALRRRKLRSMLNSKSLVGEERAALQAELDALPDAALLRSQKNKFIKEELRPWFKMNIDPTIENPSIEKMQAALNELSRVKGVGGRLDENASAREMISWVRESVERLDSAIKQTRETSGWIRRAADPYFVTHRADDLMIAGQDVPSMYAGTLMYLANQYEKMANNFKATTTRAVGKEAELAKELPLEAPARRGKAALEAGVGEKAPTLKSIAANETERKALEEARKAHRQLVELQNSDEWLAAVERHQLNELIKLFAKYNIRGEEAFVLTESPKRVAKRMFESGEKIYVLESGDGRVYREISKAEDIVDNTQYYRKEVDAGNTKYVGIGRGQKRVLRWSDELDELDEAGKIVRQGGRFRMTRPELESLFADPKEFASRRASLRAAYDEQIRQMDSEIIKVESEIQKVQLEIKRTAGGPRGRGAYSGGREFVMRSNRMRERLQVLEATLTDLRARRGDMRFTSYGNDKLMRAAALEKLSGVMQLIKRGDYSMEEIEDGLRWMSRSATNVKAVDQEVIDARIKFLDDVWESSSDAAIFNKVRELEFSNQVAHFNAAMADYDTALSTVSKYREAASKAWRFAPEEDAPYGREWSIGKYSAAKRAGKTDDEAREAARIVREYPNNPDIDVPRNVQEARYRVSAIDERTRKELQALSNATRGQYDAVARWDQLLDEGMSYVDISRTINDEVRALRPSDEALFKSATLEKNMTEIEFLRQRIGLFERVLDAKKQWWYNTTGHGQELQALVMRQGIIQQELGDALVSWDIYKQGLTDYITSRSKADAERLIKLESDMLDMMKMFDQAKAGYEDARVWSKWTKGMIERRVAKAEQMLESNAIVREASGGMNAAERADFMDWVDRMITVLDDMNESTDVITNLRADYLNAHSVLMGREDAARDILKQLEDVKDLKWGAKVVEEIEDGMIQLDKIGMPNYVASKRIAEMVQNAQRMREPEFVRGLNKFIGRYTGYFKAGAVGTPGFVVRNTMSNTFSLVSAGANPGNMVDGLKYFTQWRNAVKAGNEASWLASLTDEAREVVTYTIKSMDASGYGRSEEALAGWAPKRKWLVDNGYYRRIRSWNEASESSARFILAYDSLMKGASFDQATATVKRYLFDYVDVSQADIVMRSIVPFWFWMSRNLPLQVVNQWTHPRAYQMYRSFQRNFSSEGGEDEIMPLWLQKAGVVRIGKNTYFSPDLPFNKIEQHLSEFQDPKRLLRYVNPGIRVPFEVLLSDKRLYNDQPFSKDAQKPVGGPLSPAVRAFAELLGQGRNVPYGGRGVSDQMNYAVMNLFPQIGQLERSLPVTDTYKDKQMNSLRTLLGIPVVDVTESMMQSELRRRAREGQ